MILLLSLLTQTTCFSQGIWKDSLAVITTRQLKQANIIFAEHARLKERDSVMTEQIETMNRMMGIYNAIDSINRARINSYSQKVEDQKKEIDSISNDLKAARKKSRKKSFAIGILGAVIVTAITGVFVK